MPSRGASSNLWLSLGDNKACVFPSNKKGGDPPLKTLSSLSFVSSRAPAGMDGCMDRGDERKMSIMSLVAANNYDYPKMFLWG